MRGRQTPRDEKGESWTREREKKDARRIRPLKSAASDPPALIVISSHGPFELVTAGKKYGRITRRNSRT